MRTKQNSAATFFILAVIWGGTLGSLSADAASVLVGFSPDGSAEQIVINQIRSARREIRAAVYSLTRARIVSELVKAKQRGVDVQIKVDKLQAGNQAMQLALGRLVKAGIPVTIIDPPGNGAMHNKFAIIDGRRVVTGSFNWTANAALNNYENVVVIEDEQVAKAFLDEWRRIRSTGSAPSTRTPSPSFRSRSRSTANKHEAVQCRGIMKSGKRCKRKTTDPSGYCWQHRK